MYFFFFCSAADVSLTTIQQHKSCFKFLEASRSWGRERLLLLPIRCYLNVIQGPVCIWHPCHVNLFIESFGHTWKVKQMVHLQRSDTCAHTRATPSREPGSVGPLCILLSLLSSAALYSSPLPPMPLYVLSLCLPISGHGRLLFRHFKQI